MAVDRIYFVANGNGCGPFIPQADDLDDSSDLDDDDDGLDETQMESYNTPLDDDRCPVDEYVAFKEILSSEYLRLTTIRLYCRTLGEAQLGLFSEMDVDG